jgi:hypothetical protein
VSELTLGQLRELTKDLSDATIVRVDAGFIETTRIVKLVDTYKELVSVGRLGHKFVTYYIGSDGNNVHVFGVSDPVGGVIKLEL